MAQKPQQGGGGYRSWIGKLVQILLAFGLLFAFFQVPSDPTIKGMWGTVVAKADTLAGWLKGVGDGLEKGQLNLGFKVKEPPVAVIDFSKVSLVNPASPDFNNQALLDASLTIPTAAWDENTAYDRYQWFHWDNVTSCWTVREQVLYRDAVKDDTLTMLDANKVRTNDVSKACYITGGTWNDPYTEEVFTNPSDLDIDHMIPLGYAARGGGQAWDSDKKAQYANDLTYDHHLVAVSASANRSKSDRGPGDWKPSNSKYHCQYAISWTVISTNWNISMKPSDKSAVQDMLKTCTNNTK